jgi:hypothetical protein
MKPIQKSILWFTSICLLILLTACGGTTSTPDQATAPIAGATLTPYPELPEESASTIVEELLRFSGEGANNEHQFTLETQQIVRINWIQYCRSNFLLTIASVDPMLIEQGAGEIIFSIAANPSQGFGEYEFVPGVYIIKIDSDGPWEIWLERVTE